MLKTGAQYLETLKDGRHIYINGAKAGDVTEHPAFRRSIRSFGALYDFQSRPENSELMTFDIPSGNGRANRIWQLPGNYDDLVSRRAALESWTELHCGFLGRAPDHVASSLAGMYMGIDVFEAYDKQRAIALADYFQYARDNDLYLTYVIINPQADRSKSPSEQQDAYLAAGVVDQDSSGLTVRGAKMLGTGAVMANEVLVSMMRHAHVMFIQLLVRLGITVGPDLDSVVLPT